MRATTTGRVFIGAAGRATEVHCALEPSDRPDLTACLGTWFIDCPGQSPAWRHYGLSVIHLRPIEGVKPAVITRDGATHEVILLAYDPKGFQIDNPETWHHLAPYNFMGQLKLPSDDHAKEMLTHLAHAVADGILWAEPPLSGQQEPWASQLRLLEEHATGKHFQ